MRSCEMRAAFGAPNGAIEVYRGAEHPICVIGQELAPAVAQLAGLDQIAAAVVTKLNAAKQAAVPAFGQAKIVFYVTWRSRRVILPARSKTVAAKALTGDRSRAVWFVINALFERGKSDDEIVDVLIPTTTSRPASFSKPENPQKYVLAECVGREDRASERI